MTVLQFPTGRPFTSGYYPEQNGRERYTIEVIPDADGHGFHWAMYNDEGDGQPDEDQVASDLAAIALSLRPPKRSFLERLAYLFTGETE